jgi:hypothetical protein
METVKACIQEMNAFKIDTRLTLVKKTLIDR